MHFGKYTNVKIDRKSATKCILRTCLIFDAAELVAAADVHVEAAAAVLVEAASVIDEAASVIDEAAAVLVEAAVVLVDAAVVLVEAAALIEAVAASEDEPMKTFDITVTITTA